MDLKVRVGNRLRVVRTLSGYKQGEVAKELDVSASLLSMYEKGKREPSISFVSDFCNHHNIPLDQFFFGLIPLQDDQNETDKLSEIGNNLLAISKVFEERLLAKNLAK